MPKKQIKLCKPSIEPEWLISAHICLLFNAETGKVELLCALSVFVCVTISTLK